MIPKVYYLNMCDPSHLKLNESARMLWDGKTWTFAAGMNRYSPMNAISHYGGKKYIRTHLQHYGEFGMTSEEVGKRYIKAIKEFMESDLYKNTCDYDVVVEPVEPEVLYGTRPRFAKVICQPIVFDIGEKAIATCQIELAVFRTYLANETPGRFIIGNKYVYEYKMEGHPQCEYKEHISEYLFDSPYAATINALAHIGEYV